MESKVLSEIEKNNRGDYIVISRVTKKNGSGIDIRNFYTSEDGELLPTKKGVLIDSELIAEVLKDIIENLNEDEIADFRDENDDFEVLVRPFLKNNSDCDDEEFKTDEELMTDDE